VEIGNHYLAEQALEISDQIVPDHDSVFMRAHRNHFVNGIPGPGVYTAHEGGMSVDWCRYAQPQETKARARKPQDNAVLEMNVGHIRLIPSLDVLHTPEPTNRAHCDVPLPQEDEDLTEIRLKLTSISKIAIPLDPRP
jgi:hypothetical protein